MDESPRPLVTTTLGCASATSKTVKNLCTEAASFGGRYNKVYALAQSAGQITNFALLSWTQRLKFKLINPLLGNSSYIGSDNNAIVVNPEISVGPSGQLSAFNASRKSAGPQQSARGISGAQARYLFRRLGYRGGYHSK